ncbi:Ig-like domain-containing protein [Clostridium sp.]|uniref:Ig-like domain-containing protein n=1 Tax=Clostridium sp. TaxID=1506 RepID=UPI003F3BF19A
MKKKHIKLLSFALLLSLSSALISCTNTDSEVVISENVKEDIKIEENETTKTLKIANDYLKNNNPEEAKINYEKAISLDQSNKDTYLKIKDDYISLNKLDDAYSIIKLAIDNNVDVDNMKSILNELSSNFEITYIYSSIYQGDYFELPNEALVPISDNAVSIPITWDNTSIDTSTPGEFTYTGVNNIFGKTVKLILTVNPNIYDEEICFIKNFYTSNGKIFIDADLAIFLRGNDALQEAIKRNDSKLVTEPDGKMWIPDGYLIINDYPKITTYEVSKDATFALCCYDVKSECPTGNSDCKAPISYNEFNEYFLKNNRTDLKIDNRALFFNIKTKNGIIYDISKQHTP